MSSPGYHDGAVARGMRQSQALKAEAWRAFVARVKKRARTYPDETPLDIARAYATSTERVERALSEEE